MMKSFIKFADTLSTSMGKAFSWCIVILMGGTVYEVVMAYAFNKPTLWNFDFSMQMYGAILMMSGADMKIEKFKNYQVANNKGSL